MNELISILQVVFSVILVIVTGIYTWTAYKTWKEVRNSNKGLIVARIDILGVSATVLKIINIGNSAATNIKIRFNSFPNKKIKSEWKHYILEKDEFVRLLIKDKNKKNYSIVNLCKEFKSINLEISYTDIYGEKHSFKRSINLNNLKYSIDNNFWITEKSQKDEIHDIANTIKDIKNDFRQVFQGTKRIKTINYTKKDIELEEKQMIEHWKKMQKKQTKKTK